LQFLGSLNAFLASAASTATLQALILAPHGDFPDTAVDAARAAWCDLHTTAPPADDLCVSQRAWDAASKEHDKTAIWEAATSAIDKARILATRAPHSSDWLVALPISSCGLRLDNEAIRVAVGLRLGLQLCEAHQCPCGATVDARGLHGLSCKRSSGRGARHQQLNDLVYRALRRADIPAVKEPAGLVRSDGKRPDGLTLVPWQGGRSLTWDGTIVDTFAASYLDATSSAAGGACEAAAIKKRAKYATITASHIFTPVAVETLGPLSQETVAFLADLGNRLSASSDDPREPGFLFQRVSVLIQRYNAVAFRGSFPEDTTTEG
jgi:hypothetical protein